MPWKAMIQAQQWVSAQQEGTALFGARQAVGPG